MLQRITFIGAHPDDIEINAGGLINRLTREGSAVSVIVLSGKHTHRHAEAEAAAARVGCNQLHVLGYPDTKLDQFVSEAAEECHQLIQYYRSDTVISHFHADTHQDHVAAYKIAVVAARRVRNFLMFKPTYPSGRPDVPFHPTFIAKLDAEDVKAKMQALDEFHSQKVKYGSDEWLGACESIARGDAWTYGGLHGYAEVFQVGRLVL